MPGSVPERHVGVRDDVCFPVLGEPLGLAHVGPRPVGGVTVYRVDRQPHVDTGRRLTWNSFDNFKI